MSGHRIGMRLALLALAAAGVTGAGPMAAQAAGAAGSGAAGGSAARSAPAATQTWSVQPTPPIPDPTGGLASVSCTSPGFCASVSDVAYAGGLAAVWNGTSWRKEPLPGPVALRAVSCASPTFCAAVGGPSRGGTTEAVTWNGTTWTAAPSPSLNGYMEGVSCSSSSACLAVGEIFNAKDVPHPRVERWNGEKWSLVANPMKNSFADLSAVSCSSASACTATGDYRSKSGADTPLIERWDGSRLVVQQSAQPPSQDGSLVGVSCPVSDGCIAVGTVSFSTPQIEIWNGTSWAMMTSPAVSATLSGVSCTTITACTAVARPLRPSGPAVAEQLSGSTWTVTQVSGPAGASDVYLDGVSCPLAAGCMAVGGYDSRYHSDKSLAEQWNGSQWAIHATPNDPMTPEGSFTGVSCSDPDACAAIGNFQTSDGATIALGEKWNGSQWALTAPLPPSGDTTLPASVSCPAAAMCMAVGSRQKRDSGQEYPWAAAWNGTRWVSTVLPGAVGSIYGDQLSGVSCVSATSCIAVGSLATAASNTRALAYAWDGTQWTKLPRPAPGPGYLYGVSCTSATWCVAVGGHRSTWLADAWNGTAWTVQPTSGFPGIGAVSCSSASACTAVGESRGEPAVERWDGTNWTAQQPATAPANAGFSGVSCASATACTAVGKYPTGQYSAAPIIQSWDGSSWVAEPLPDTGSSSLASVSCTSASLCTAAGEQGDPIDGVDQTPLAERSG